jgi:copper chaperone
MNEKVTYSVPAIHCAHCAMSIREEVSEVEGVDDVAVDLDTKVVTVTGRKLDDRALRAAIAEAGYEAA